ncbi:MAG: ABC transporter permease [Cyclobacteriaceae bacterium]
MKSPSPILIRIFKACSPKAGFDDIEGDQLELYQERLEKSGKYLADLHFLKDAFSLLYLKLISKRRSKYTTHNLMLKNYFKIASRNLLKDKSYAFINISGLAIGMACAFIILIYVKLELSYDTFHQKADQIYRMQHIYSVVGAPNGPGIVQEYPEAIDVTRIHPWSEDRRIKVNDQEFFEDLWYADENFFETFSFKFIRGDPSTSLQDIHSIVLTQSLAERYFGDDDPIGKTIVIESLDQNPETPVKVTGVIEDIPYNSHLQFEQIVPFKNIERNPNVSVVDSWINDWIATYLVLEKGADPTRIEADYPRFFEEKSGNEWTDPFRLMPMLDVRHKSSHLNFDFIEQGNIDHIRIFSIVAILVLLIACINYMNLATAKAVQRAKEVGIRKVMGAVKQQLISQFMVESILISILAVMLGGMIIWLSLPLIYQVSGIDLTQGLTNINTLIFYGIVITLTTGFVSGSYPALYLSSFGAAQILRESKNPGKGSAFIRKSLVVLQLIVSVSLIVGTIVVIDQMNFIKNKDLGFNAEQVLVFQYGRKPAVNEKWDLINPAISSIPGVVEVASSSSVPGNISPYWGYQFEGDEADEGGDGWPGYYMGPNALDILDIEVVMGRTFSDEIHSDSAAFILNERAWKEAITTYGDHWNEPLGKTIGYYEQGSDGMELLKRGPVIGVIKDFHHRSLQNGMESIVFQMHDVNDKILVKVEASSVNKVVSSIEQNWRNWGSAKPFSYEFLDQQFAKYYEAEERFSKMLYVFCNIAIFIACLGLYGLASFTAQRRFKEIGIRKVLGASVGTIFQMITSDFVKLIGLALLVAFPLSWYLADQWLNNFEYRIDISWISFLIATLTTIIISLATVSWQSLKASVSNPVDSLRAE